MHWFELGLDEPSSNTLEYSIYGIFAHIWNKIDLANSISGDICLRIVFDNSTPGNICIIIVLDNPINGKTCIKIDIVY